MCSGGLGFLALLLGHLVAQASLGGRSSEQMAGEESPWEEGQQVSSGGAKGSRGVKAAQMSSARGGYPRWGFFPVLTPGGSVQPFPCAIVGADFALLHFPGPMASAMDDRKIIKALAAPDATHRRLLRTARLLPGVLQDASDHTLALSTELYGSLSLNVRLSRKQDWPSHYVNGRSDVDFVVEMRHKVAPAAVAQRLLKRGGWRLVAQVQVHKFASTQFTLAGSFEDEDEEESEEEEGSEDKSEGEKEPSEVENATSETEKSTSVGEEKISEGSCEGEKEASDGTSEGPEEYAESEKDKESEKGKEGRGKAAPGRSRERTEVYLDITCIETKLHFDRFQLRQEAFRRVFLETRMHYEAQLGNKGCLAFDAYVHLLKAFAAKVPATALTGFQATCIGLFILQRGYVQPRANQSYALSFFEGFLQFCVSFFGDPTWNAEERPHFRSHSIDLSKTRYQDRVSRSWQTELYFSEVEEQMNTRPDERMNVTHSLDPTRVSMEALALLQRAFSSHSSPMCGAPFLRYPPMMVGVAHAQYMGGPTRNL